MRHACVRRQCGQLRSSSTQIADHTGDRIPHPLPVSIEFPTAAAVVGWVQVPERSGRPGGARGRNTDLPNGVGVALAN